MAAIRFRTTAQVSEILTRHGLDSQEARERFINEHGITRDAADTVDSDRPRYHVKLLTQQRVAVGDGTEMTMPQVVGEGWADTTNDAYYASLADRLEPAP